ncbi:MAG: hypothetical protein IIT54_01945 [Acetobacter sp.]|nr:hypothetical protein [Acetobacter sp.]
MIPTKLISRFGFLQSVASVIDMRGRLYGYETLEDAQKADCEALASDWKVVGQELAKAIQIYDQTHEVKL